MFSQPCDCESFILLSTTYGGWQSLKIGAHPAMYLTQRHFKMTRLLAGIFKEITVEDRSVPLSQPAEKG